jgi:DNA-binding transcriptional ArsR family regulator
MSLPHPIPDDLIELISYRLRAIAEPMRIKLLDRLRDGEACVGELVDAAGASQQNVSKHLQILLDAGIVGKRRDGNRTYYRIVDQGVFSLCDQVCGTLQRQFAELGALLEGVEGTGNGRRGGRK